MFCGSDFRGSDRNFTIGQSPKIWGKFSKICIKIHKNLKKYRENGRKMQIFRKFFIFGWDYGKTKKYNMDRLYSRKIRENFGNLLEKIENFSLKLSKIEKFCLKFVMF